MHKVRKGESGMKLTFKQIIGKQKEIIALKNEEIELLEEIISKPEIIGMMASLKYINKRFDIHKKLIKLEVEVEDDGLI